MVSDAHAREAVRRHLRKPHFVALAGRYLTLFSDEYTAGAVFDALTAASAPVQLRQIALEGAGGAVILCSLTTLIGYVSLYASANRALNSFGLAMSIGEVTCLGASVIALPAFLHLLESRARRPAVEETTTHE
jgi:uncharacterized membrane protein YdfJ with MMPL/SSD domain